MAHPVPVELYERGSVHNAPPTHYACSVCSTAWPARGQAQWAKHTAERCCTTTCDTCGGEKPLRGYCSPCRAKSEAEREAAAFEKAEKLTPETYTGPVYDPDTERFFESAGDALDEYEDEERDAPAYLWTCSISTPSIDVDQVLEHVLEEHHEDAQVDDEAELRAFIDAWNAKQTTKSWHPDYSRAVVLGGDAS